MSIKEIIDSFNGKAKHQARVRIAVGTTIGVIVGAAAGILLAPKSGKETRKDIKNAAERGAKHVSKTAHKVEKFVKKEAAETKEKINDFKTHFKHSDEIDKDSVDDVAAENKSEE